VYTHRSPSLSNECSDSQIRQEHIRLEPGRVQNKGMRWSGHRDEKGENGLGFSE